MFSNWEHVETFFLLTKTTRIANWDIRNRAKETLVSKEVNQYLPHLHLLYSLICSHPHVQFKLYWQQKLHSKCLAVFFPHSWCALVPVFSFLRIISISNTFLFWKLALRACFFSHLSAFEFSLNFTRPDSDLCFAKSVRCYPTGDIYKLDGCMGKGSRAVFNQSWVHKDSSWK